MGLFFNKQRKCDMHKKFMYGGIQFRTKSEMERYIFLESMMDDGRISNLLVYPEIELIPRIVEEVEVDGKKRKRVRQKAIMFRPDFTYVDNDGNKIVEEVLSEKKLKNNKYYNLKKKLLLYLHGTEVKEIKERTEWVNYGKKPR